MIESSKRSLLKWAACAGAISLLAICAAPTAFAADRPGGSLPAVRTRDLIGLWEGKAAAIKFTRAPGGQLNGTLYFLRDDTAGFTRNGFPMSSITIDGRNVQMILQQPGSELEGTVSDDGKTLAGTFNYGENHNPFKMTRTARKKAK